MRAKLISTTIVIFFFGMYESMFSGNQEKQINIQNNYAKESFETIKKIFDSQKGWGLHTTIDLKNCNPNSIRSAKAIEYYVIELCKLIEMKRFGEPCIVHFGENENVAGFSMTQLIETSLISGHFVNKTNYAYIDIFSCKLYDPHIAKKFTKNFFKADTCTVNVLLRT